MPTFVLHDNPNYDPEEWTLIPSKGDFFWYLKTVDLKFRQEFKHVGEPTTYPCFVHSEYQSEECHPDWFKHTFRYREPHTCDRCGATSYHWPKEPEEN